MATGTVFDSPYFALERPAFEKMAEWSSGLLTFLLFIAAGVLAAVAIMGNTLVKAIVLAWVILP